MYISKIHIQNFRNFNDFYMDFHKGLNVIIGANNSGKTGLLYAIKLLSDPAISVDDFNKYNLLKYSELYKEDAPSIVVEYSIEHTITEDDATDESIIKLLPFMGIKDFSESRVENDGKAEYHISAKIKAQYILDAKYIDDYKKAVEGITDFDKFYLQLKYFVANHYNWIYTNGISDTKAESKEIKDIFDIRFIEAERTSEEVRKEAKREIERYIKQPENAASLEEFKQEVSDELKTQLSTPINKLTELFENENNDIGLKKGNVSITPSIKANLSISDSYLTEVKDTKHKYILPLSYNGLGYNNLINIYMLIKLNEIQIGRDFRILCLEEPEAHLHPAMQYKLFKYLRKLDKDNQLNQQIFVSTHSSNISAVAGLDNMFMFAHNNEIDPPECLQQSLEQHFTNTDTNSHKAEAKKHLTKFLDVTRSDMLFADKVILVEGIAEKLLMPMFMESCGLSYEDNHVSIVEIGGKHFEHFIELFNGNQVKKKVLCVTDKDFCWLTEEGVFDSKSNYDSFVPTHISKLKERFDIEELMIVTQSEGGKTFEDELFFVNINNIDVAQELFKLAISDLLKPFFEENGFDLQKWSEQKDELHQATKKLIEKYLNAYSEREDKEANLTEFYSNLCFSELFLHYAGQRKGDIALQILTNPKMYDENEQSKVIVPGYIKEGLEWLMQ